MKLLTEDKINKIWNFFLNFYETEECRVCNKRIRCISSQFIKNNGKIKCTECQRYLEAVKEK